MNELRWILLGIGLVLLALIYLFARRSGANDNRLPDDTRYEPSLSADERTESAVLEDDPDAVIPSKAASRFDANEEPRTTGSNFTTTPALGPLDEDSSGVSHTTSPKLEAVDQQPGHDESAKPNAAPDHATTQTVPEKVIALHLMPKAGQLFEGIDFIGAIQAEGLKFGRFDIFHRYVNPEVADESSPSQFSLANMLKPGTFNLHDLHSQQFKGASMFLVLPGPEDAVAAFADMVATGRRLAATLDGQLLDAQGTALSRQSASHLREDIINYQHGLSATPAE